MDESSLLNPDNKQEISKANQKLTGIFKGAIYDATPTQVQDYVSEVAMRWIADALAAQGRAV